MHVCDSSITNQCHWLIIAATEVDVKEKKTLTILRKSGLRLHACLSVCLSVWRECDCMSLHENCMSVCVCVITWLIDFLSIDRLIDWLTHHHHPPSHHRHCPCRCMLNRSIDWLRFRPTNWLPKKNNQNPLKPIWIYDEFFWLPGSSCQHEVSKVWHAFNPLHTTINISQIWSWTRLHVKQDSETLEIWLFKKSTEKISIKKIGANWLIERLRK